MSAELTRAERRAQRRAVRQERKNGLAKRLAKVIEAFLDNEFQKISNEFAGKMPIAGAQLNFESVLKTVRQDLLKEGTAAAQATDLVMKVHAKFKEQIRIVYEVAIANGYSVADLPKEAVLYVILDALSRKNLGLAVISAQTKTIGLKLQGKNMTAKIAQIMAFVLVGLLVRSALVRYVPVAGELINVLLGPAGNQMNIKVFEKIKALCADHYKFHTDNKTPLDTRTLEKAEEEVAKEPAEPADDRTALHHLLSLVVLAYKDGQASGQELQTIQTLVAASDLDEDEKRIIQETIANPTDHQPDFSLLKANRELAENLLTDMLTLASVDAEIAPAEKDYIKQAAAALGFSTEEIAQRLV